MGTCGAVIVAVGAPYVARRRARAAQPVLKIVFENMDPWVHPLPEADRLAFSVTNSGRSAATGVRAQLRCYWARRDTPVSGQHWLRPVIDPAPLAWVSRPSVLEVPLRETVTLPAQSSDFARFGILHLGQLVGVVAVDDHEIGPTLPSTVPIVEYRFDVTVTADNADPITARLWCKVPVEATPVSPTIESVGVGADEPAADDTHVHVGGAPGKPLVGT